MNFASIHQACRRAALGLGLGLIGITSAHAGAVSVDFDPAFGSALPNLSWSGTFSFFVSDSCILQAPENVLSPICQPTVGHGTLTLTDMLNSRSATAAFDLNVKKIFVIHDAVVAWQTNRTDWLTNFRSLPAAQGSDFRFGYASLLPQLFAKVPQTCGAQQRSSSDRHGDDDEDCDDTIVVRAAHAGLDGMITSVVRGQAVNYRLTYAAGAVFTPQSSVPEPGSLALLVAAFSAAGFARRRRA